MNTIKFAPYNEFMTEQHNVEIAGFENHTVSGKDLKFYNPCNLNVFIHNKCQNDCFFCINKQNDRSDIVDDVYYNNLDNALAALKDVHLEATITGGEPTLNPERFVETIRILKHYGIKERTVSTTGIGLLNKYENKTLLQHLIELDYTHNISVSRMAITDEDNNRILQGKNISNDVLKNIAYFSIINGVQLRTSTNVISGEIDTLEKILSFVDFQHGNYIESCLFRELIGKNSVSIAPMVEQIKNDPRFKYERTLNGMFYNIDVYLYKAVTGQEYVVKCYETNVIDNTAIGTLSYNQGKIRLGFNGEVIYG